MKVGRRKTIIITRATYISWDIVHLGSDWCKLVYYLLHMLSVFIKQLLRPIVAIALDRDVCEITRQQHNVDPVPVVCYNPQEHHYNLTLLSIHKDMPTTI